MDSIIIQNIGKDMENTITHEPNEITALAIEESRRIAYDSESKGYSDINELRKASEVPENQ